MNKDEKLGMSNHLLENYPVNEKICVEPVAKRPDKLEKATRPLISPRSFHFTF